MNLHVDMQSASNEPAPEESDIRGWISAALAAAQHTGDTEVTVRVVDEQEMTQLNQTYRDKPGPTNVLSFPADLPQDMALPLLGDIVICAPVVRAEADQQHKTLQAHWAHMTVHGTLHLLGYDHIEDQEAATMEALESNILRQLNFDCPYETPVQREQTS